MRPKSIKTTKYSNHMGALARYRVIQCADSKQHWILHKHYHFSESIQFIWLVSTTQEGVTDQQSLECKNGHHISFPYL